MSAGDAVHVPKDKLISCLRDAGFSYKRETTRVEIWKLSRPRRRVDVLKRSWFTELQTRRILAQAGLSEAEINDFLGTIAQPR